MKYANVYESINNQNVIQRLTFFSARLLEKPQSSDNKTVVNVAPSPQMNMGETQGQDAQDRDNSNRGI